MEKWIKLDKGVIFTEHKEEFLRDYALFFEDNNICASCKSKLDDYYNNFKQVFILKTKEINNEYKVSPAYNGVQLEFGSNIILSNANLTEELALLFLAKKENGKDLFETLPNDIDERLEAFTAEKTFDVVAIDGEVIGVKTLDWEGNFLGLEFDQENYEESTGENDEVIYIPIVNDDLKGENLDDILENKDQADESPEVEKADEDLTLTELKAKYPDITSNSQKGFLEKLKAGN